MDSPWGERRGAAMAPPRHKSSRRSEMAGDKASTTSKSWRSMARQVGGEWTEWRLGDWETAASLQVVSLPLIPFRDVAIFSHPKKGCLVPLTNGVTSLGCHSGVPLVPMVLRALLMERCATIQQAIMISTIVSILHCRHELRIIATLRNTVLCPCGKFLVMM